MSKKKAIVIGAGILGLATARALAESGYKVKVFERNMQASGASVRNFGMVWPVGQPAGVLYQRAIRSRDIWKQIAGTGALWADPVGSLHTAYQADEWQVLQELYEIFKEQNRDVKLYSKEQVLKASRVAVAENCLGGLYSSEELIVDPRQAIANLPAYMHEQLEIKFYWGQAVTRIHYPSVIAGGKHYNADLIFVCSGADFETLYPDEYQAYPLTRCKLQMMRMLQADAAERVGPALCGGLSLTHYAAFKGAPSLPALKQRFENELPDHIKWGIHVMLSQNESGEITIGDSHEYGLAPDPFDRQFRSIELILDYLKGFAHLKKSDHSYKAGMGYMVN